MRPIRRLEAVVAGLWAGILLSIGAIAAPAAFATLASGDAGRLVGRLFAQEAYLSLSVAVVLIAIDRVRRRHEAAAAHGPVFGANLLLLLGTLFCTIGGYFAVLPMMVLARAGTGPFSFLTLHAVSAGLFVLKGLLVLALAWRLALINPTATTS